LRWDPGARGVAALGVAVLIVVAAAGWWLLTGRPSEAPVTAAGPSGTAVIGADSSVPAAVPSASASLPAGAAASSAASSAASTVVVDVAGKVRRPGIYQLPSGARIFDALRAAGGPKPGVSTMSLNLAQVLQDGEQIVVGAPAGAPAGGAGPAGGSSGGGGAAATPAVVDLNNATLEQLETLPGVGPVLGQNILDWRDAHGRFATVDQLRDVSGIGDVRLGQLRPLVSV
jgi:competence protein ComEA